MVTRYEATGTVSDGIGVQPNKSPTSRTRRPNVPMTRTPAEQRWGRTAKRDQVDAASRPTGETGGSSMKRIISRTATLVVIVRARSQVESKFFRLHLCDGLSLTVKNRSFIAVVTNQQRGHTSGALMPYRQNLHHRGRTAEPSLCFVPRRALPAAPVLHPLGSGGPRRRHGSGCLLWCGTTRCGRVAACRSLPPLSPTRA